MEVLIQLLLAIHPLSDALQQHLRDILREQTFLKKEFLLRNGSTSKQIFFIKSGLVSCFYSKNQVTKISRQSKTQLSTAFPTNSYNISMTTIRNSTSSAASSPPIQYLASYFGVSPKTLSTIRQQKRIKY